MRYKSERSREGSGRGGKLRLGVLIATVAAFLLVPAAQALAASVATMKVNVVGTGSGEVTSTNLGPGTEPTESEHWGTPDIRCSYASPGPQEGTCENGELPGNAEIANAKLFAYAAAGTATHAYWTIEKGIDYWGKGGEPCGTYDAEGEELYGGPYCQLTTENPAEGIEVTVCFVLEGEGEAGCVAGPAGPPLTLSIIEGSGTVVSNPAGLECSGAAPKSCTTEEVAEGQVTLTASPVAGYQFKGWKKCDKTNLPEAGNGVVGRKCTITLNGARTVEASFIPAVSLAVTKVGPTAGGTVSTSPAGVNCGTTCTSSTAFYKEGALTLKQKKAKHFHFVEFKGGTGSAASCNGVTTETCGPFTIEANSSIEAQFAEDAKATLAYSAEGGGQGSVKTKPTGIACGYTCTAASAEFYEADGPIEVIVKLNKGTSSVEWTTGAGTCTGKVETVESTCTVPAGTTALVAKFE